MSTDATPNATPKPNPDITDEDILDLVNGGTEYIMFRRAEEMGFGEVEGHDVWMEGGRVRADGRTAALEKFALEEELPEGTQVRPVAARSWVEPVTISYERRVKLS